MTIENRITRLLQLDASREGGRLFRNHVGTAWHGRVIDDRRDGKHRIITLCDARQVTHGLAPGSSDVIGWKPVVITPDMVGKRVAVFRAVEVKSADGRLRDKQRQFLAVIAEAGGVAEVAREAGDGYVVEAP